MNDVSRSDAAASAPSSAPPRSGLIANVVVALASLAFAMILAEVVVRVFIPVREVGPRFAVHDPVYGKRLRPNFSGERRMLESTYTVTTNSLGFRGAEPTLPLKDTILFIGDSFTMGYGVTDGRELPAVVRSTLRSEVGASAHEVINAGVGHSGNGRWVRFLQRDAKALAPKIVVLQYCQNDPVDNLREGFFTLDDRGALVENPAPVEMTTMRRGQEIVEAIPGITSSYLFNLVLEAMLADRTWNATASGKRVTEVHEHPRYAYVRDLTTKLVERSIELAQQNGWATFLILPVELVPADQLDQLRAMAAARDTPIIETPSKKDRPDLFFTIDGHWNEAGHADAAARLLQHPRFRALTHPQPTEP